MIFMTGIYLENENKTLSDLAVLKKNLEYESILVAIFFFLLCVHHY